MMMMIIFFIISILLVYFLTGIIIRKFIFYSCGAIGFDCICLFRVIDFIFTWYFRLFDFIKSKYKSKTKGIA